jgi:hypothetical protein
VVLSHVGWKTLFAGAPDAIGRTLTLDGRAYTVVGIMPPIFEFYPRQVLFWTLLTAADVARQASAKAHAMGCVGRLCPGVSRSAAEAEIASTRAALERAEPDELLRAGAMVASLQQEFTWLAGRGLRSGLLLLFGAVAFVLLIACANVAILLAGRALERRREIAVRAALGAGGRRLIRLILVENLLLSPMGALAGALLAYGGLRYFLARQPVELPIGTQVTLDIGGRSCSLPSSPFSQPCSRVCSRAGTLHAGSSTTCSSRAVAPHAAAGPSSARGACWWWGK